MNLAQWAYVLPTLIAVAMAIATRRVLLSLLVGVLIAQFVLNRSSLGSLPLAMVDHVFDVVADRGNLVIILFSLLVGGLLHLIRLGRGFEGVIAALSRHESDIGPGRVYGLTWLVGVTMFLEVWSNVLVNGASSGPLFDRLGLSRLRLAYYAHTIAICTVSLIVFNGWGAFYIALLAGQGIAAAAKFVVSAVPYMFYNWASLVVVLLAMHGTLNIGPMRRAESLAPPPTDVRRPVRQDKGRALFMLGPIATLLAVVLLVMALTGNGNILMGDGGLAVLSAVVSASLVAIGLLISIGRRRFTDVGRCYVGGVARFYRFGLLIVLALTFGDLTQQLGTGLTIANVATQVMSPAAIPAAIFVLSATMAFATGTSYGTFAIMIPVALPIANAVGADAQLVFAACIGGGVFGDNCSPISDTTIVTAAATNVEAIDHVRTQLPYAMIASVVSVLAFLFAGAMTFGQG